MAHQINAIVIDIKFLTHQREYIQYIQLAQLAKILRVVIGRSANAARTSIGIGGGWSSHIARSAATIPTALVVAVRCGHDIAMGFGMGGDALIIDDLLRVAAQSVQ